MNPIFLILMLGTLSIVGTEVMYPLMMEKPTHTGLDPWHLFWYWWLSIFCTAGFAYQFGREVK